MTNPEKPQQQFPPIGIYEHYKSTPEAKRYYQVLGFANHTESHEILVVYLPLYLDPRHSGPILQARPLSMFVEEIEINGKLLPRFRFIGTELS